MNGAGLDLAESPYVVVERMTAGTTGEVK